MSDLFDALETSRKAQGLTAGIREHIAIGKALEQVGRDTVSREYVRAAIKLIEQGHRELTETAKILKQLIS